MWSSAWVKSPDTVAARIMDVVELASAAPQADWMQDRPTASEGIAVVRTAGPV